MSEEIKPIVLPERIIQFIEFLEECEKWRLNKMKSLGIPKDREGVPEPRKIIYK